MGADIGSLTCGKSAEAERSIAIITISAVAPQLSASVASVSPLDAEARRGYNVTTPWSSMKSRLIRIGNSRGVRLPKPLIEEAGLQEEVEVQVRGGALVISSRRQPRAGWAEAARQMRDRGDDRLLEGPTATRFDDEEWRWR